MVKVNAEKQPDGTGGGCWACTWPAVGPRAARQGYLSVNWQATVDEIAHFIQPHPSLSETFGEVVLSLTGRSLNS